jgi:hypothetical protein
MVQGRVRRLLLANVRTACFEEHERPAQGPKLRHPCCGDGPARRIL